jgi:hypothetical protein
VNVRSRAIWARSTSRDKAAVWAVAWGLFAACLSSTTALAAPAIEAPKASTETTSSDEFEPPFRLSLPTIEDDKAWQSAGFRLQLGRTYGATYGIAGAPEGAANGYLIRAGARLDQRWSLLTTAHYEALGDDLSGLRYAVTIDPTWHVRGRWSVAIGAGFGGINESLTRSDKDAPLNDGLVATYTHPNNDNLLPICSGFGGAALSRVNWDFVLGANSSLGLTIQADVTYTACQLKTKRVDPDTAQPIYRRQYWTLWAVHAGTTVSWR